MYDTPIKKFTIYNKLTGEITGLIAASEFLVSMRVQRDPNLEFIEGEFSPEIYYFKNNQLEEYTEEQKTKKQIPPAPLFIGTWSNETMEWMPIQDITTLSQGIVLERNKLLSDTDWTDTLSAKSRLGEDLYNQWQIYRQQLRDITNQPNYPYQVTWPNAPS
jgi:hypothetical protein